MYRSCPALRVSAQMSMLRRGAPLPSTSRQPIIWALKLMQATAAGAIPVRSSRARVEAHTAPHQSSAFCSTQPSLG